MLARIRMWLHCWRLAKLRDLKMVFTRCRHCGRHGAYPCSILDCIDLCDRCQRVESNKLDIRWESTGGNVPKQAEQDRHALWIVKQ
jgi:hypothetical protein